MEIILKEDIIGLGYKNDRVATAAISLSPQAKLSSLQLRQRKF